MKACIVCNREAVFVQTIRELTISLCNLHRTYSPVSKETELNWGDLAERKMP